MRCFASMSLAAAIAGNTAVARAKYAELLRLMDRADASRPEPPAAREFLARRVASPG